MAQPNRKILRLTGLLLVSLLASLVAADLVLRALTPAPYAPPRILRDDHTEIPLAEIISMLRTSGTGNGASPGPTSTIRGNLQMKLCYDRPQWSYFDSDGCVTVDINSLGFRDLEFTVEKKPDELRILAIGDSFTFGSGVQLADTWPQQLETRLQSEKGHPVEVINAGYAGGHWPPTYAAWLASDGMDFGPDVVVVGLCLNDIQTEIPMMHVIAKPEPWLGGISVLLNRMQDWRTRAEPVTFDYGDAFRPIPEPMRSRLSPEEVARIEAWRQPWEDTKAACIAMRDLTSARSVRFVVAILPMISRLGDDYPFLGLHELVREFCALEKIECVDLLPAFRNQDAPSLWVHPTDQHPNDVGQRMIADGIHDYLQM